MESKVQAWLKIVALYAIAGGVIGLAVQSHLDLNYIGYQVGKIKITAGSGNGDKNQPPPAPPEQVTNLDIKPYLADNDPAWGPKDAKVTIVAYSDYQCPFCRRFHENAYKKIKDAYGDKIRYVFKHFPLRSIHPHADGAAAAAYCANEQGKFWQFSDKLFSNMSNLSAEALTGYAEDEGLNMTKFAKCMASPEAKKKIDADLDGGVKLGITGTPGFIVDGTKISGAQPFERFKQAIDAALAK